MEREFDVIVFGASGFTGELVVEEMAKNVTQVHLKWAVAGRNHQKVQQILVEVQKRLNTDHELKNIKIFQADVADKKSLELMCENTKLLINCVGPYAEYGEPVVEACLKCGTHVIDLSAEISYIDNIILKYHHEAESRRVYIITSCGMAYLYFEMGVQVLQQKFEDGIDKIDVFIKPGCKRRSIHFATWQSYVNMFASMTKFLVTRQKLYSEIMKKTMSKWKILALSCPIKLSKEGVSFLYSAVMHTGDLGLDMKEVFFEEKKVKVNYYMTLDSLQRFLGFCTVTFFLSCMLPFSTGRRLLTKYAGFFSCGLVKKPTLIDETEDIATFDFTAVATSWSQRERTNLNVDRKVVLHGRSPPSYKCSAICAVQSALTVLEEIDRLPKTGGVYVPLAAFAKTSLTSRLQKNGITYQEKEVV